MKILQVALGNQFDIRDALAKHGDVIYYDWSGRERLFNSDIVALKDKHKPDLIWLQIQTSNIINPQVAKYLTDGSIVVNWTGDVRYPLPQWYIEIGKQIDLTLFTNMNDVEECRRYGVNADYLQIGFPTNIFKPQGLRREEAEIVFMGNNVGGFPLSQFRVTMVEALKREFGRSFKVYGVNWPGYGYEPNQEEEAKIYRGCKIAINLSHFDYSRYSSDRLWRIIGSGAFCLSHNYKDIDKEFEVSKHLDVWNDIPELVEKIKYYLHPGESERVKIAEQGCDYVHKNHTWEQRINQLIDRL